MDLLIKNLEMPKGGAFYVVLRPNGAYCYGHVDESFSYHQVVEVKPHGRLIDADKLADDFYIQLTVTSPYMQRSVADQMVENVRLASQIAPTVLEASDNSCPADDDDHSYEMQSDMRDYCERYEPTYNPEDGSM